MDKLSQAEKILLDCDAGGKYTMINVERRNAQ